MTQLRICFNLFAITGTMYLLLLMSVVIFNAIYIKPDADAHLKAPEYIYPRDDYTSAVDFALAEPAKISDVKFVHFDNFGTEVNVGQLKNLPTKILLHGWLSSIAMSPWFPQLKDAYIKEPTPINVIYFEYEKIAAKHYSVATASTINVANVLANYLLDSGIDLDNIHLIGHSLGAHLAGFTGRAIYNITGRQISRITLLDAAGPKFDMTANILHENDAKFVDVLHTDCGHYGMTARIGHVDFYPNGGGFQPGCPSHDEDSNCSHARSVKYFIESVGCKPKICKAAEDWDDFVRQEIKGFVNEELVVFGDNVPHDLRGSFYCRTNSQAPFLPK